MDEITTQQLLLSDATSKGLVPLGEQVRLTLENITGLGDYDATVADLTARIEAYEDAQNQANGMAREAATATTTLTAETSAYDYMIDQAKAGTDDYNAALAASREAADLVTGSMKEYNAQLLFQQVAATLDAEAQLVLAAHLGLVDAASLTVLATLPGLTAQFDANGDGAVGAGEDVQGYLQALLDLDAQAQAMDGQSTHSEHIHDNIVRNYTYGYNVPDDAGDAVPYASGGRYSAGQFMSVGEQGRELMTPDSSGYVFDHQRADRLIAALERMANAGATTNNFYGAQAESEYGYLRARAGAAI
jgi:hypothetical protein